MLSLEDCIARAPLRLVYLGTERQLLENLSEKSASQVEGVDVEFAADAQEALKLAFELESPVVVYGLFKYMHDWDYAAKLRVLMACQALKIEFAEHEELAIDQAILDSISSSSVS